MKDIQLTKINIGKNN